MVLSAEAERCAFEVLLDRIGHDDDGNARFRPARAQQRLEAVVRVEIEVDEYDVETTGAQLRPGVLDVDCMVDFECGAASASEQCADALGLGPLGFDQE